MSILLLLLTATNCPKIRLLGAIGVLQNGSVDIISKSLPIAQNGSVDIISKSLPIAQNGSVDIISKSLPIAPSNLIFGQFVPALLPLFAVLETLCAH